MCKVIKRFLFFYKFLDLKILFIYVKLCGNCNLGLIILGVFFGVELNCGKGFCL